MKLSMLTAAITLIWVGTSSFAQTPHIVSVSPAPNELNVSTSSDISITFSANMNEMTFTHQTLSIAARSTGLHWGTIIYDSLTNTATLNPTEDFDVGETVTVSVTSGILSSEGIPLESSYIWSFTVVSYDGAGSFILDSLYSVGRYPSSVFAADLDGDADIDLVTANRTSHTVSVLKNDGNGVLGPHSQYYIGSNNLCNSVYAADLDGDFDLDLVTANEEGDNVSVLWNCGDGTFSTYEAYPVGGDGPVFVMPADLDGDGDFDLVTANSHSANVSVLLNGGGGGFICDSVYPTASDSRSVFAADMDGDGDIDLTCVGSGSTSGSVLINNGNGTFAPYSVYSVGSGPYSVFGGDLDEDGDIDLVTANLASNNVSVLKNDGNGFFASDSTYSVGISPVAVFVADFDGDGDLDLSSANKFGSASNSISVLLNNGDGSFDSHCSYPGPSHPASVFAADYDGDGDLDLAAPSMDNDNVAVVLNEGPYLLRSDANADSTITMSDAIYTLKYLYVPGSDSLLCMDAGDSDDNGEIAMSDAIYTLKYLYVPGAPQPPPPFPDCGVDLTPDELGCEAHPCMGARQAVRKKMGSVR